jgi:hypothetical protein
MSVVNPKRPNPRCSESTLRAHSDQSAPQRKGKLFDHLVGGGKQRPQDVQAERLCDLEIKDKLGPRSSAKAIGLRNIKWPQSARGISRMPYTAVFAPADSVLKAVVPPEKFTTNNECRRTKNTKVSGHAGFRRQSYHGLSPIC